MTYTFNSAQEILDFNNYYQMRQSAESAHKIKTQDLDEAVQNFMEARDSYNSEIHGPFIDYLYKNLFGHNRPNTYIVSVESIISGIEDSYVAVVKLDPELSDICYEVIDLSILSSELKNKNLDIDYFLQNFTNIPGRIGDEDAAFSFESVELENDAGKVNAHSEFNVTHEGDALIQLFYKHISAFTDGGFEIDQDVLDVLKRTNPLMHRLTTFLVEKAVNSEDFNNEWFKNYKMLGQVA